MNHQGGLVKAYNQFIKDLKEDKDFLALQQTVIKKISYIMRNSGIGLLKEDCNQACI